MKNNCLDSVQICLAEIVSCFLLHAYLLQYLIMFSELKFCGILVWVFVFCCSESIHNQVILGNVCFMHGIPHGMCILGMFVKCGIDTCFGNDQYYTTVT